ncbi:Polyamine aminopropyltransferase [Burkholderiales bacterium]|nr:Polyamine aminopropyltransferase [Burkholderiales bacterium]
MTRALALLLTVFTGFTGLVYEVAWQRYLATLLGSHSEATAAILGIFLGGLSLGYSVFGALVRRILARASAAGRKPRLLLLYGGVEASIGVYGLAFPWLFGAVQSLSVAIPHGADGAGFALDVALTALLVGPPTVLMGGTIPVLTQALANDLEDATRFHAFVYASNTAGAFAGALFAGFVLVPWLGLVVVVRAMGAINLVAGALFAAIGSLESEATAAVPVPPLHGESRAPSVAPYAAVALLAGFSMMAIQTVLNRIGALSFGASQFTFSMVVAVFVLCIALGSLAVSLLPRIPPWLVVVSQALLVGLLLALYGQVENAPWAVHALRSVFRDDPASFFPYWTSAFVGLLLLLAAPIGLSGALLPLLFHHLRHRHADLGSVAGRLYAWNTLGSLAGALLGGYALLFWLDLHHVFRIAVAGLAIATAILAVTVLRVALPTTAGVLALALAGIALLPAWRPDRITAGAFRSRQSIEQTWKGPEAFYTALGTRWRTEFHDDDPISTVSVTRLDVPAGTTRAILTNGKVDGNVPGDNPTVILAAVLPLLYVDPARSAFVIGYGTGMTAGVLASIPEVDRVVVAEISPGVIAAAPLFDFANRKASQSPKLEIVRSDAYRALLRSEERFDVIVSEPSNPWVVGVEMLFSEEFLRAARSRLGPKGVFAQWLQAYETDDASLGTVLRTYSSVFPKVAVWYGLSSDLILLGLNDPQADVSIEGIEARIEEPAIASALRLTGIDGLAALVAHEVLPKGVLAEMRLEGDRHTLLHPVLSDRAARAFFVGAQASVPAPTNRAALDASVEASLIRRLAARSGGRLDDDLRHGVAKQWCRGGLARCATLVADWKRDDPDPPGLRRLFEDLGIDPARPPEGLRPEVLDRLERLFDLDASDGTPTFDELERMTEDFDRFWTPAAPFDPRVLLALWQRCAAAGDLRCVERGERLRRRFEAGRVGA